MKSADSHQAPMSSCSRMTTNDMESVSSCILVYSPRAKKLLSNLQSSECLELPQCDAKSTTASDATTAPDRSNSLQVAAPGAQERAQKRPVKSACSVERRRSLSITRNEILAVPVRNQVRSGQSQIDDRPQGRYAAPTRLSNACSVNSHVQMRSGQPAPQRTEWHSSRSPSRDQDRLRCERRRTHGIVSESHDPASSSGSGYRPDSMRASTPRIRIDPARQSSHCSPFRGHQNDTPPPPPAWMSSPPPGSQISLCSPRASLQTLPMWAQELSPRNTLKTLAPAASAQRLPRSQSPRPQASQCMTRFTPERYASRQAGVSVPASQCAILRGTKLERRRSQSPVATQEKPGKVWRW